MSLKTTLMSYFLFPTISNNNMADTITCEVGAPLYTAQMTSGNRYLTTYVTFAEAAFCTM
jgi:hypothetical protein